MKTEPLEGTTDKLYQKKLQVLTHYKCINCICVGISEIQDHHLLTQFTNSKAYLTFIYSSTVAVTAQDGL